MKRLISAFLLCSLLAGCSMPAYRQKQYTATFLTLFDTVTTIVGTAESEASFQETIQPIYDGLEEYHQLFDIYGSYEGLNNLKTVNDNAGVAPVAVDAKIIDLLRDCKIYYDLTSGKVNVAMGSVLALWHRAREDGYNDPMNACLPAQSALEEAAQHTAIDSLVIDEDAGTVYLSDPLSRLDVGAIAKGWAVQRVCQAAPAGLLVSVGGNVCATGPKDDRGTPWVIGIQDPNGSDRYLHTLNIQTGCVVTSGDYQRTYTVEGRAYHHIIDPETLFPGTLWRSVSVVSGDSGLADALSTALFLLSREAGQALLDQTDAKAMWVCPDGEILYSTGFEELIRT